MSDWNPSSMLETLALLALIVLTCLCLYLIFLVLSFPLLLFSSFQDGGLKPQKKTRLTEVQCPQGTWPCLLTFFQEDYVAE